MFKKSYSIGKIAGIPIKIHISFLVILPFLAWAFGNNIKYVTDSTNISYSKLFLDPYLLGLILAVALFISVIMHELTHSLVARNKGVEINHITLMLFGGIAHMEELTEKPGDEAQMALSGPALSIVLGLFLILLFKVLPKTILEDIRLIVLYIGQLNIFLGIFNLLPAFPSDGGRVLRAVIAMKTSFLKATRIASTVGKVFAVGFGLLGLVWGNFLLIFIGFFLYIGASQEYQYNLIKDTLSDLSISDLMTAKVSTVTDNISVQSLLDKMFEEKHSGYPVVNDGKLIGMVTMKDVQKVTRDSYSSTPVRQIMSREIKTVEPGDDLYKAFKLLFKKDIGRLAVVKGEREELMGIITRSDILKGFRVQQLKAELNKADNK